MNGTPTLTIRRETVLDVARDVIRPEGWMCEWNIGALQKPMMCRMVLNSYATYLKHLLQHAQQSKVNGSGYTCRLPRCNIASGVPISSYDTLATHIQQSHLSRAQLCCPIRGCSSMSFSRHAQLENHVVEDHVDFIDVAISLPSPSMMPSWRPYRPLFTPPPPLPSQMVAPGTALLPLVEDTPKRVRETLEASSSQQSIFFSTQPTNSQESQESTFSPPRATSSQQSTFASPRRRPRLQANESMEDVLVPRDPPPFDFDDLPRIVFAEDRPEDVAQEYSVRSKGPRLDLSRPQVILDRDLAKYAHRPPKPSVLYHNFVVINNLQHIREEPTPEPEAGATAENLAISSAS